MQLPSLVYDYANALITNVSFGPRREFVLTVAILVFEGANGRLIEGVRIRFGGVENLQQVSEFFSLKPHEQSELASIKYSPSLPSKPGRLMLELDFERIDAKLVVRCSSLQIM